MIKNTNKPKTQEKKKSTTASPSILKTAQTILEKLKDLDLDQSLQSDIVWCIGSYNHDQNPVGLYEKVAQALEVFKTEKAKKTKGITAKLITDIEKALAAK